MQTTELGDFDALARFEHVVADGHDHVVVLEDGRKDFHAVAGLKSGLDRDEHRGLVGRIDLEDAALVVTREDGVRRESLRVPVFGKDDADAHEHAGAEAEIEVRDGKDGDHGACAFGELVGDHFHGALEDGSGVGVCGDFGPLSDLEETEVAFDDRDSGLDAVNLDDLQDRFAGGDERPFVDVAVADVADVGTGVPVGENARVVEFDFRGGEARFAVLDIGLALDKRGFLDLHGAFGVFELGIAGGVPFVEELQAFVLGFAELE